MGKRTFIVRMSSRGYSEYALEKSKAVIGWSKLGGMDLWDSDEKKRRENIKEALREHSSKDERSIGAQAGSIDRFLFSIKKGDYIIFPVNRGFYLGTAQGDEAKYNPDPILPLHERDVEWKKEKGEPVEYDRGILISGLQSTLKRRQTCPHPLSGQYTEELEKAIRANEKIDLNYRMLGRGQSGECVALVKKRIQESFDGNTTFEKFLEKILEKAGGKTKILPKKQKKEGDVDIDALFRVNCMGGNDDFSEDFWYGYQCKHHKGETGTEPVEQLIKRARAIEERSGEDADEEPGLRNYRRLFSVTSGEHGEGARRRVEEFHESRQGEGTIIELVDGDDLARWVIEIGLEGLNVSKN